MKLDDWAKIGTLVGGLAVALGVLGTMMVFVAGSVVATATLKLDERIEELENGKEPPPVVETSGGAVATSTDSPETRERTFSHSRRNNHCQGPRSVSWRIEADEGWSIDPESVSAQHSSSSKSSYGGIIDASGSGFTIKGTVANNGECIRVLGNTVARDGRGSLGVWGTYTEIKDQ